MRCSRVCFERGLAAIVAAVAGANRAEELFGLLSEECDQDELLLARREPLGLEPDIFGGRRVVVERPHPVGEQLDRPRDGGVHGAGRSAEASLDERAELVDDRSVAAGGENVDQRLRGEDLADRRRERRPAGLTPDLLQLVERLQQAVIGRVRTQMRVECRDEPGRQVVLRRAHGNPRGVRCHDLVADVLVDEVGRLP